MAQLALCCSGYAAVDPARSGRPPGLYIRAAGGVKAGDKGRQNRNIVLRVKNPFHSLRLLPPGALLLQSIRPALPLSFTGCRRCGSYLLPGGVAGRGRCGFLFCEAGKITALPTKRAQLQPCPCCPCSYQRNG